MKSKELHHGYVIRVAKIKEIRQPVVVRMCDVEKLVWEDLQYTKEFRESKRENKCYECLKKCID